MIELFTEVNLFHITPNIRFFYDLDFDNKISDLHLEFAWLKWGILIKLKN